MNEAAAISFQNALNACMEAGCGRDMDSHDFSEPWSQQALAEQIGVSDRLIRKWLKGDSQPTLNNFDQLLLVMTPKPCPRQEAAYARLRCSRPPPRITRQKPRPSATAAPTPPPPIPHDARPYRGLEAFRENDAHLFFGRDALAQKVLDKLEHHRLVLLIGASGSGKSSLINAGIIPKLRQDPARTIVRCTPGDRAIANLAAALARAMEPDRSPADLLPAQHTYRQQLEADPEAIRDIAQLLPEGRLFLVIDQFEESFTLTRPANPKQHEALVATLLAIARSPDERRLNALLGMRSDFQNELETADPELIQRLDNAMVQMRSMFPAEREAAITEPARAYGVGLEPGLLTAITADLADNRDALPLLEVALDELWSRRDDTSRRLTSAAFTEIGGIPGALGQRADSALEHLGLDETLVRRLFLQLVRVDPEGASTKTTRRPRTRQELGEELWQLGERLAAPGLRLLVTYHDDTTGEQLLDVTHEAIFREWQWLAGWIEEERDFLLFCQRLDQRLADFTASGENPDYLLPRTDVQEAQRWQIERGKTFHPDHQDYIHQSAAHWADNAADDEARALWARLELSFDESDDMPEHDLLTLTDLCFTQLGTLRRVLILATADQDSARKFNRQPALLLRAVLGLDPATAIARAAPALDGSPATTNETGFAWLTLASHLAPVTAIDASRTVNCVIELAAEATYLSELYALPVAYLAGHLDRAAATHTVDRAIELAAKTVSPRMLQALAQGIAGLASRLDRATVTRTLDRVIELVAETTDLNQLQVLSQAIAALAGRLDPGEIRAVATHTVDLAAETTNPYRLYAQAQAIAALAGHLDRRAIHAAANRTVDRAIELAVGTNYPHALQVLVQAIAALADHLEPGAISLAATRALDRAIALAAETTDAYQFRALAQAIAALARHLDPGAIRAATTRTVERATALVAAATAPNQLQDLAQAIAALAGNVDPAAIGPAVARTVDRALELAAKTTDPFQLRALAQSVAALAGHLDRAAATRTIDHAIELAAKTVSPPALQALAHAIACLASRLDRATATRTLDRLIELVAETTDPDQLQVLSQAIAALAGHLGPGEIRAAATQTVDWAIELAAKTTNSYGLSALAQAVAALAGHLDPAAIGPVVTRSVDRALDLAAKTNDPDQFRALAQAVAALALHLPVPVAAHVAIEFLKQPLGGDEQVTQTLLGTITTALDRPDLLRPFPEQSFWAVMQHLAELKAAHPDWDWLDLARPPLPPDKLVATFRRLCANPPDWPKPAET